LERGVAGVFSEASLINYYLIIPIHEFYTKFIGQKKMAVLESRAMAMMLKK
jgi:hypothetical protein